MAVNRLVAVDLGAGIGLGYATALAVNLNGCLGMPTWEYVTTPLLIHNTTAILNNWGSQGWELVQIVTGPEGGLVAYLKRPLEADE